jgi:post-segregation antitoxin (ccd killing protein)
MAKEILTIAVSSKLKHEARASGLNLSMISRNAIIEAMERLRKKESGRGEVSQDVAPNHREGTCEVTSK